LCGPFQQAGVVVVVVAVSVVTLVLVALVVVDTVVVSVVVVAVSVVVAEVTVALVVLVVPVMLVAVTVLPVVAVPVVAVPVVAVSVVAVEPVTELAVAVVVHALQCAGHMLRTDTPNTCASQLFIGGPNLSQSGTSGSPLQAGVVVVAVVTLVELRVLLD